MPTTSTVIDRFALANEATRQYVAGRAFEPLLHQRHQLGASLRRADAHDG